MRRWEAPCSAPTITRCAAPVVQDGRMPQRTVTIAEAARLTGLSKDAIRSRIERGSLRVSKRGGVRRVPLDELAGLGLLAGGGEVGNREPLTTDQLLDRLERQAEQI